MAWKIFDRMFAEHPADIGAWDSFIKAIKRIEDGIDHDTDSLVNYELDSVEHGVTIFFTPRHDGIMPVYMTSRPLTRAVPDDIEMSAGELV